MAGGPASPGISGMTVHILKHGFALCGWSGVPFTWGPDEQWTDNRDDATCGGCIKAWRDPRFVTETPEDNDMFEGTA